MRLRAFLLVPASGLLAACGTIIHGTRQDVGISSSPTSARVTIDNQQRGTTPLVAKLSRKDNHIVRIELDGYQPFETTLIRKTSGWVWGNIVFGAIVGLAVDAIDGGMYKLTPEQIHGQLATRTGSRMLRHEDGVYVLLVPRADPAWMKVGALQH